MQLQGADGSVQGADERASQGRPSFRSMTHPSEPHVLLRLYVTLFYHIPAPELIVAQEEPPKLDCWLLERATSTFLQNLIDMTMALA